MDRNGVPASASLTRSARCVRPSAGKVPGIGMHCVSLRSFPSSWKDLGPPSGYHTGLHVSCPCVLAFRWGVELPVVHAEQRSRVSGPLPISRMCHGSGTRHPDDPLGTRCCVGFHPSMPVRRGAGQAHPQHCRRIWLTFGKLSVFGWRKRGRNTINRE